MKSIEHLSYFTIENVKDLKGLKDASLKQFIRRKLGEGEFIQLKRGIYTTKAFINTLDIMELNSYKEFIATIIKEPSYISKEYVLSKYQIIPEMTGKITCLTSSRPYIIGNRFGTYSYSYIKNDLFGGYEIKYFRDAPYYIAKPSKALFDFIYSRSSIIPDIKGINLVKEMRLDLSSFKIDDWADINNYTKITKSRKLKWIFYNLYQNASNN